MVSNKTLVSILLAVAFCATFCHAAPYRYRRTSGQALDPLAALSSVCTPLLTAVDGLTGTITVTVSTTVGTAGAVLTPLLGTASTLVQSLVSNNLLGLPLSGVGATVGGVLNTVTNCVNVLTHLNLGNILHIGGLCQVPILLNGVLLPVTSIVSGLGINLSGGAAVEIHKS